MHLRSDTTSENNSVQSTNVHQNIEETVVAFEAFPAIGTARTLPSVMPQMETSRGNVTFQTRSEGWNTYNFEVAEYHTYVADGVRVHNTSVYTYDSLGNVISHVQDADGVVDYDPAVHSATELGYYDESGSFVRTGTALHPLNHANGTPTGITRPDRLIDFNTSDPGSGFNSSFDAGENVPSPGDRPIVLDLDGDGVELSVGQSTSFDMDNDGYREQTSWAAADDGFLVLDLNADGTRGAGDGEIDQSRELVFALWGDEGDTDLQALRRAFDDNNDGVLNNQDGVWSELRVWQDVNQNGETDDGELRTLDQVVVTETDSNGVVIERLGITEINLGYDDGSDYGDTDDDINVFGNTLHGLSSFTVGGVTIAGSVGDVTLAGNTLGWREVPTSIGYSIEFENGQSLHYAVQDGTGTANVNLDTLVLDGATGDTRANHLTAQGHSRSVQIAGGTGNDSVWGGDNDDLLSGDAGTDDIRGHGGNDVLFVDAADLTIGHVSGGDGIDTLIVTGDVGVNVTLLNHEVEAVHGGDGNDNFSGLGLADDLSISGGAGNDTIGGSNANDRLSGDDGNDHIHGREGDDFLFGGAGNDTLNGEHGDDFILGGGQADFINGGNGDDNLIGGDGNDTLNGGGHDDVLDGGAGDDVLNGGLSDDLMRGGAGNDSFYFWRGDNHMIGGEGNDTFYLQTDAQYGNTGHWGWSIVQGGEGNDTLQLSLDAVDHVIYKGGNQWQLINYIDGGRKVIIDLQDIEQIVFSDGTTQTLSTDTTANTSDAYVRTSYDWSMGDGQQTTNANGQYFISGTNQYWTGPVLYGWAGNDGLSGNSGANVINGGQGDDVIQGNAGNDELIGGHGDDQIFGGDGNDVIRGFSGSDIMAGGTGNDLLIGHEGSDQIWGDAGQDTLHGNTGSDLLSGGDGNDDLHGGAGSDNLYGGTGNDTLQGGSGADRLSGNEGADVLHGQQGADQLYGGAGNDTLFGGDGFDALYGEAGDDSLDGGADDGWLYGGEGNDTLTGGIGRDVLHGGAGADVLNGNGGILDVASYAGSDAGVNVNLATNTASGGHAQGDTISNIENLVGSDHADTFTGDGQDNVIEGGDANDVIIGGAGHDAIDGGDHNDVIHAGVGDDRVWGSEGDDTLNGDAGNDALFGGDGVDQLYGGDGNDQLNAGDNGTIHFQFLRGGAGDDVYTVSSTGGRTAIWDEVAGGGNDRVVFSDVSFSDLTIVQQHGNISDGMILQTAGGGLNLHFSTRSQIESFEFADGTVINDFHFGGDGDDNITGGSGNDFIDLGSDVSGNGAQIARGGAGDDIYFITRDTGYAGIGYEAANGGYDRIIFSDVSFDEASIRQHPSAAYPDSIIITDDTGMNIHVHGASGTNNAIESFEFADGTVINDFQFGGTGNDDIAGGSGNDRLEGGRGNDSLTGGEGNDVIHTGTFDNNTANWGTDTARGGNGNDHIKGSNGTDYIYGDAGNDTLSGGDDWQTADPDYLYGGDGNDYLLSGQTTIQADHQHRGDHLFGGNGNDTLEAGLADDHLDGGAGVDTATYANSSAGVLVDLRGVGSSGWWGVSGGNAAGDVITNIENLIGSDHNDTFVGDTGNNVISGGAGSDYLHGWSGDDVIYGGVGNDRIHGNSGSDTLRGGDGVDKLKGGTGDDHLYGGAGADTFEFVSGDGNDRIYDFEDGADLIQFTGISAISDLTIAQHSGYSTVTNAAGGVLRLDNILVADLTQDDFLFV